MFKKFSGSGYGNYETVVIDEAEFKRHQLLEKLYISTRTGKHFQRDIVHGVEGLVATGSKQIEIGRKLSKYGGALSTVFKMVLNSIRVSDTFQYEKLQ